jgi:hypothetical protein
MSNKLNSFWKELNREGKYPNEKEWFSAIAYRLMNDLSLNVGKNCYRITECEFYYLDMDNHEDPYVHGEQQQMTTGQLYYNRAGGLDITFGNESYPAFGGILIRGIRNLETNEYINQITKIVSEVFMALGNIIEGKGCICLSELEEGKIKTEKPIQSTRVGLREREDDNENYLDQPYRFIVELVPEHRFKEKEKVVKALLAENKISREEAKAILSYYPSK